jgi:hypothetical protein
MKAGLRHIMVMAIIMITIIACSKSTETDSGGNVVPPPQPPPTSSCASVPAKFSTDISTIIQNSCAISSGCHGNGSINGPGPLTTFNQIKNAAASIKSEVVSKRMPLGGSLTNSQIQSISCWVDNGALNN